jgi:Flp pilus assembly protein TadG
MAPRKRNNQQRRGAVMVEFAIVAPVFFMILFAMFEFSRLNIIRHTADNAAYEAARLAIVPGATAADATAEANRILRVVGTRNATVNVTPAAITEDTQEVTVQIAVPMNDNALVTPRFTGAAVLRSSATLRTERVRTR